MLAQEELSGNEDEDPHRWWLVSNVIAGYAMSRSGMLQPDTRTFLVKSSGEGNVRDILGEQFPTINFDEQPLAIYPLSHGTPAALDYEAPYNQDVVEISKDHGLL